MTLEEYINRLNKILKENPCLKESLVVYSNDDEGNLFKPVYYEPQPGYYNNSDNEFNDMPDTGCIAVCIN